MLQRCGLRKFQVTDDQTRLIRLQGVEERNVRDQIALGTFLSLRMLATYMRRMRNYNLEIRIAGSSCRPQLSNYS